MTRWLLVWVAGLLLLAPASVAAQGEQVVDVPGQVRVGNDFASSAVVWLEAPVEPGQQQVAVLDQRNLAFNPRVLVVSVGSTVEFPNSDRVLHNVFSFHAGQRFDLGLYPVGETKRVRFEVPGVSRVLCNIHPGMAAYVVVVDSPYFAVSDREGVFVLHDVPPGQYRYHVWRPGSETLSDTTTIGPDARLEVQWPVL